MANIISALVLFILGLFMVVCNKAMVRFQTWSQRSLMGAQYIPSQRTYTAMRIVGAFLIVLALLVYTGVLGK